MDVDGERCGRGVRRAVGGPARHRDVCELALARRRQIDRELEGDRATLVDEDIADGRDDAAAADSQRCGRQDRANLDTVGGYDLELDVIRDDAAVGERSACEIDARE